MGEKIQEQINTVIDRHRQMLGEFEQTGCSKIVDITEAIAESIRNGGTIYICGNGGSAADAQHIASELVGRFEKDRKPLPAIALTTDTSLLTSVANDYSFNNVFARQVEALVKKGDILWVISTSGKSPNIIAAAQAARKKKAAVIAFTGRKNSELERLADICFCADDKMTARSQEIHTLAYHIICGLLEQKFYS